MADWSDLVRARAELQDLVQPHISSLVFFRDPNEMRSFFRTAADRRRATEAQSSNPAGTEDERQVRRLTTTFTCAESLWEAGKDGRDIAREVVDEFSSHALDHPDDWRSEGAARTYCIVRSLPPLLTMTPNLTAAQLDEVRDLLDQAWSRVAPGSQTEGIFEVSQSGSKGSEYPPNAYLSYWGLVAYEHAEAAGILPVGLKDGLKRRLVEGWLERCLANQVTLHAARSNRSDPQQLAWALCGVLFSRPEPLAERSFTAPDLVIAALEALFDQQVDGAWPRGEPLFHYPEAGNAYCYTFETLAELVSFALRADSLSTEFRQLLHLHADRLLESVHNARRTARSLEGPQNVGWSSGHHPHRTTPESWATASVFRFLQGMRRLIGIWTRDAAASRLEARQPTVGLEIFRERGDTWNAGYGPVGVQLSTSFVHPVTASRDPDGADDPDLPALPDGLARSAILFGPPGTGKTTFVEAIAGALGWKFIEITPAMFLDRGVDFVSARADEVFRMLMELDHYVVLFDEIDELIRRRDSGSDTLERFFTTTMLPRLARLWRRGKIMFFVNTNAIDLVDPAIRRSQRFDAALFVLPPSYEVKRQVLATSGVQLDIDLKEIERLMVNDTTGVAPSHHVLIWLALLRWDQTRRLAHRLASGEEKPTEDALLGALDDYGNEMLEADWQDSRNDPSEVTTTPNVLQRLAELRKHQRRDPANAQVVRASEGISPPVDVTVVKAGYWRVESGEDDLTKWAIKHNLALRADGVVYPTSP